MELDSLKIVVSAIGGVVYLAEMEDDHLMNDEVRKDVTEDVLAATTEWFIYNKHTAVSFPFNNDTETAHLFFTDDDEKAERILAIIREGREEEG